jgi:hypothetical protein
VRLVDREQGDAATVEQPLGRRDAEPLRCDVQQVEVAGDERALDFLALPRLLRRVEEPRAHAERAQGVDLVLHQRDQRRDHDADAVAHERRDLVAQ